MATLKICLLHVFLFIILTSQLFHVVNTLSDKNLEKAIQDMKQQKYFGQRPQFQNIRNKTQKQIQLKGALPQYNFVLDRIPNREHKEGVVGYFNRLQDKSIARSLQVKDVENLMKPLVITKRLLLEFRIVRDFLTIPRLREILGPGFKLTDYKTNSELIWGIIHNALNAKEIEDNLYLFNALRNVLSTIHETGEDFLVLDEELFDRLRGIWIQRPRNDLLSTLLNVLCQCSNDHKKLAKLQHIFNKPKSNVLGQNFDLHNYSTVGELFEAVLLNAFDPKEREDGFDQYDKLKFYTYWLKQNDGNLHRKPSYEIESLPSFSQKVDPDVELLLTSLSYSAKNDSRVHYLKELLNHPNLKTILGDFDLPEAPTRGALLRAILLQALNSVEIQHNTGVFNAIQYFLTQIKEDGDAIELLDPDFYTRFSNSREKLTIDTLISALTSYFEGAAKVPPLKDLLNRKTLAGILGPLFDCSSYSSTENLTQAALKIIIDSEEVKENSELYAIISKIYKEKSALNYTKKQRRFSPKGEYSLFYKLDNILSALHIKLNESVLAPVREFVNETEIVNDITDNGFHYKGHKNASFLLNRLLTRLLNSALVKNNPMLKSNIQIILDQFRMVLKTFQRVFNDSSEISTFSSEQLKKLNATAIKTLLKLYHDDEIKLKQITKILEDNSTNLADVLGTHFNPNASIDLSVFLESMLSSLLSSEGVTNDSELKESLLLYLEKVKKYIDRDFSQKRVFYDGIGGTPPEVPNTLNENANSTWHTDYLLTALGKYAKENSTRLQKLREFLNMLNITQLLGTKFSFSKYSTKTELLKAILISALNNKDIENSKTLYETLKFYVAMLYDNNKTSEGIVFPNVDFLLRAINDKNNSKLMYLHDFLSSPNLGTILGSDFNPHRYYTNGQLLSAIISYALNSSYAKKSANIFKILETFKLEVTFRGEGNLPVGPDFFYKLNEYTRVDRRTISEYPNVEILLKSLSPESRNDKRLAYLFKFLINSDLYKIIGAELNPYMYETNGELLRAILEHALRSVHVQCDLHLHEILKYFLAQIRTHGLGNIKIGSHFFYKLQLKSLDLKPASDEEMLYNHIDTLLYAFNQNKGVTINNRFLHEDSIALRELEHFLKETTEKKEPGSNTEVQKAVKYFTKKFVQGKDKNDTLGKYISEQLVRRATESFEVYPNIEYLVNALHTKYKQGREYTELLRFLTESDLRASFKPGFNYKKYNTNGELLGAILKYAKHPSSEFEYLMLGLKNDEGGKLPLEPEFFLHIQRKERRLYNPYIDYLLFSALGYEAKQYIEPLRQFLTDPQLILHLGGMQFDAYPTLGELMRAILQRLIHVERVREEPVLYKLVLDCLNMIHAGGNASKPSNYEPDDYPVTFDMNAIISALDVKSMYRDGLELTVRKIRDFFLYEFKPYSQLVYFPFEVFRTRADFLKGLFNHLLVSNYISAKSKEALKTSLRYIKSTGPGSGPADYIPFIAE